MTYKVTAVVTGVAGQDGSYLSELLLEKGYRVVGISRRKSTKEGLDNIKHLLSNENFILLNGDITDATIIYRVLNQYKPIEWYNLAAQSNVGHSFQEPLATFDIDAKAVMIQLEAIRQLSPYTKFYQASTSELFGGIRCPKGGYTESSPFHPRSPYGVAKLAAFWAVKNYREAYGLYACNGILHNHSSPRRGEDFATRKITQGCARIRYGLQKTLKMGNLEAFRDEGHAKDMVKGMYLMLQQDYAEDYLLATHDGATIREMLEYVCEISGLKIDEVYEQDSRFMRPSEVPYLLGDSSKARKELGWKSEYDWKALLKEMYENDVKIIENSLGL